MFILYTFYIIKLDICIWIKENLYKWYIGICIKNCLKLLYFLLDIICILIFCCFRVYEVVWDLVYGDLDMDGIFLDRYVYILGRNDDIFNIL